MLLGPSQSFARSEAATGGPALLGGRAAAGAGLARKRFRVFFVQWDRAHRKWDGGGAEANEHAESSDFPRRSSASFGEL